MDPDYTNFKGFNMNANYHRLPLDAAHFAAGNYNHHSEANSSFAGGRHYHQPNSTFWPVGNHPQLVPTVNNHQQNNDILVAGNQINTNNHAVISGNNLHVSPYIEALLEADFARFSLVPDTRPTGFVTAPSYDVGSSSSGNRNYSMFNGDTSGNDVVSLSRQPQLRDIQRMRIQSAARGQVGMYMQPQINSGFESFDRFFINPNLNEIWNNNIPNLYNQPQSFGNVFVSSSYDDLVVESLLNSIRNTNGHGNGGNFIQHSGNGNGGNCQYRSLAADRIETSGMMARNGSICRPRQWSLEEMRGKIFSVSKHQPGCRFLQEKLEKGEAEEVNMIIMEIKDHICELMVDQFGNYLVHNYLAVCNQNQELITELLLSVIKDEDTFRNICVDPHGSRSVQKLLEYLATQEQRSFAISALRRITLPLIKSINGHHVIRYCLKHFSSEEKKHILNEIADNCIEIAVDKSGCCVLQPCLDHAEGEPMRRLVAEITSNALFLSEHPYGNYVVQYILGLKIGPITADIMAQLSGSLISLSMSKYGSNVVEKFLKDEPQDEQVELIVKELIHSPPAFLSVVQDPYGNYVAQSAFRASKGALRMAMTNLVLANYASLHSHLHGQRVISCIRGNRSQSRV